jgi:hypothetical protein
MEAFWNWKRSNVLKQFCMGKYNWNEFTEIWTSVCTKTNEMPERNTELYYEYYNWDPQEPGRFESTTTDLKFFKIFYDEKIIPIRQALGLTI